MTNEAERSDKMSCETAIAELQLLRENVQGALAHIHSDTAASQRYRAERIDAYNRRLEALALAIEALTKQSGVS